MPVSKIIVKSVNQQGCILTAQKHISLREKNGAMSTGITITIMNTNMSIMAMPVMNMTMITTTAMPATVMITTIPIIMITTTLIPIIMSTGACLKFCILSGIRI